jgi:CBS domain-containing protein
MSRQVVTVGPGASAKYAGEVMAERGFAALPVVDDDNRLVGIVAEADVLRGRLQQDPRLHQRRDGPHGAIPPLLVSGVMTTAVRTVLATADVAELAHVFLDEGLRSVPVLDDERLVGMVSRRDALRALARSDDEIGRDVRRLVDSYTGRTDEWTVTVTEGVVDLRRPAAMSPEAPAADSADEDADTVETLARTVPGVVAVRLHPEARPSA